MEELKRVEVISSKPLDEACALNTFINIRWLCLAAFVLASASAFLKVSHSSLGIWPGAFGQSRLPRNWVCPVPTIAWLHTLQLYSFRGAFSELAGSSLAGWSYKIFRLGASTEISQPLDSHGWQSPQPSHGPPHQAEGTLGLMKESPEPERLVAGGARAPEEELPDPEAL